MNSIPAGSLVCLFVWCFTPLSTIFQLYRGGTGRMILATLTCCKIHHIGAKPHLLLKPQELLEVQKEYGPPYPGGGRWLLSGPTLGPLSQPLGALLEGELEKDL